MLGNKTSTSCFILWDAAGNSIEDPDGAILGYYIYFRKDGSNNTFDRLDVQEENRTGSDVKELQEYTRYEFHIVAYSYYGEGNASDVFHCVTEEDGRYRSLDENINTHNKSVCFSLCSHYFVVYKEN